MDQGEQVMYRTRMGTKGFCGTLAVGLILVWREEHVGCGRRGDEDRPSPDV